MTIYFIDEDYPTLWPWILELELRDQRVVPILDADRAFHILRSATDIEWVIIDVMLAGSEQLDSQYTENRTDQGLTTGLVLLQDLCQIRPDVFPAKAHLLTAATNRHPYQAANRMSRELNVPLTLKTDIEGPADFGDVVLKAINRTSVTYGI